MNKNVRGAIDNIERVRAYLALLNQSREFPEIDEFLKKADYDLNGAVLKLSA